jgi:pantetheine-phosphate adenylyltransferase
MFKTIFVAGTFDHLHKGHEAFLAAAFDAAERVIIGLTSDAFAKTYKPEPITPYAKRREVLELWLKSRGLTDRVDVIPIESPHEPAASNGYEAIAVTSENKFRVKEINDIRTSRNLKPLAAVEIELVTAVDGLPISSTRIKDGEIDISGRLMMPEALREMLQKPLGRVLPEAEIRSRVNVDKSKIRITVGDVTAKKLIDAGMMPSLAVIDLAVRRRPYLPFAEYHFDPRARIIKVQSGPGFISRTAKEAIGDWAVDLNASHLPYVIVVSGEEDLLVLPVIAAAPIGSLIYYGQPPDLAGTEGLVEVEVTPAKKREVEEILKQFT